MKRLQKYFILSILLFSIVGCGARQSQQAANSDYTMTMEPMSTAVGETTLMITLTDSENNPVNDATLSVKGDMTHAGMQPVLAETANGSNGTYSVPFEWTMGGDWIVTIDATLADGTLVSQQFDNISIGGEMDDMEMEDGDMEMDMEDEG